MAFPYNGNIPGANDLLSVSQGQMQTNFSSIKSLVDVNHEDFASADAGKHMFVTFTKQTINPTSGSDQLVLYNRTSSITSLAELCFRRSTSATIIEITSALNTTTGWTYYPSGMLVQWGLTPWTNAQSFTNVTFPKTFGAVPYTIQLTPNFSLILPSSNADSLFIGDGTGGTTAPTTSTFQMRSSSGQNTYGGKNVYWMAIGTGF